MSEEKQNTPILEKKPIILTKGTIKNKRWHRIAVVLYVVLHIIVALVSVFILDEASEYYARPTPITGSLALSIDDFGRMVRDQYPQYNNLGNVELGRLVYSNHPDINWRVNDPETLEEERLKNQRESVLEGIFTVLIIYLVMWGLQKAYFYIALTPENEETKDRP